VALSPRITQTIRAWPQAAQSLLTPKPLVLGLVAALVSTVVQAIPTAVIPNPFFQRMTPVRPQDFVFLGVTSILIGLIFSTFGVPKGTVSCQNRALGAGLLSTLAIGCPICNHVVVALIGISGALTYWAPIQPIVGVVAIFVLLWTLNKRLQSVASPVERPETALKGRPSRTVLGLDGDEGEK